MNKREKRIAEIIKHLVGTTLPLHKALTEHERNDKIFVCDLLSKITQTSPTYKWEKVNEPA